MTSVYTGDNALVVAPADLFRSGYNPHQPSCIGSEAEFFATRGGRIAPAAACENITTALRAQGHTASLEFAGIIEYAGPPFTVTDIGKLTAASRTAYQAFVRTTAAHGYVLEQTSHVASLTMAEAESKVGVNPRAAAGLKSMQMNAPMGCRLLPLMNASVQVSLNVRNDQELFDTLGIAYRLTPFIYAAFANHPSMFNGEDCSRHHARGKLYEAYGPAGGISQAFSRARTPAELVDLHMQDLVKTKLFFSFSADGQQMNVPQNGLVPFNHLAANEQTVSNFRLAQSFNYHDNKICDIRDSSDRVTGKRVEVRGFDTGYENMMAAPVFCALALRTPAITQKIEVLLAGYGLGGAPRDYAPLLQESRQAAVYHDGKYMDVAFGRRRDGTAGSMLEFSRDLGFILQEAVSTRPTNMQVALAPLLKRCASGVSRAQELAVS